MAGRSQSESEPCEQGGIWECQGEAQHLQNAFYLQVRAWQWVAFTGVRQHCCRQGRLPSGRRGAAEGVAGCWLRQHWVAMARHPQQLRWDLTLRSPMLMSTPVSQTLSRALWLWPGTAADARALCVSPLRGVCLSQLTTPVGFSALHI